MTDSTVTSPANTGSRIGRCMWPLALLAVAVAAATGLAVWQSALRGRRCEVQGTVFRAGRPIPMANCRITFINRDKGVFVPVRLEANGKYRVRNHINCKLPPGTCNDCGLPRGTYQVAISFPPKFRPPSKSRTEPWPPEELELRLGKYIPKKYRDPETSELTLTLTSEDAVFDVDMKD